MQGPICWRQICKGSRLHTFPDLRAFTNASQNWPQVGGGSPCLICKFWPIRAQGKDEGKCLDFLFRQRGRSDLWPNNMDQTGIQGGHLKRDHRPHWVKWPNDSPPSMRSGRLLTRKKETLHNINLDPKSWLVEIYEDAEGWEAVWSLDTSTAVGRPVLSCFGGGWGRLRPSLPPWILAVLPCPKAFSIGRHKRRKTWNRRQECGFICHSETKNFGNKSWQTSTRQWFAHNNEKHGHHSWACIE